MPQVTRAVNQKSCWWVSIDRQSDLSGALQQSLFATFPILFVMTNSYLRISREIRVTQETRSRPAWNLFCQLLSCCERNQISSDRPPACFTVTSLYNWFRNNMMGYNIEHTSSTGCQMCSHFGGISLSYTFSIVSLSLISTTKRIRL